MLPAMELRPFNQSPPALGNQYRDDRTLRSWLERVLPPDVREYVAPELDDLGELAGGELYQAQLADRENEPRLVTWSPWGERIDEIEVSPLWRRAERLAAERGIVATAYERRSGPWSRVHQLALMYLFAPSTDVYSCPLAMTDGAARTLSVAGNAALAERAIPRLTSRDPARFWTSGQWMTESTGGSDVGKSETVATQGADGTWRLWGRKWFTSATTSQMTLTLARPEGNAAGGKGLALFYVETRDDSGRLRDIEVHRLKDKLGTRKVPTAELTLRGTAAVPVSGLQNGIRNIAPMLNVTRTWNAVCSVAGMGRAVALSRDYARRREAFGGPLAQKPLHLDTLAGLAAEQQAAFALGFRVAELMGRIESGDASDDEEALFRLLTPIAKLTTAKQAVATASEALESFGGAGYVEDTGLPKLLRDAQVLPIWEGTTNVLSLDVLRALGHAPGVAGVLARDLEARVRRVTDPELRAAASSALGAVQRALEWLTQSAAEPPRVEAGARRFALTLGRSIELVLAAEHADWCLCEQRDARAQRAVLRFASHGFDLLRDEPLERSRSVALDE